MLPALKNNAAAGYKGLVKIELWMEVSLLTDFNKLYCTFLNTNLPPPPPPHRPSTIPFLPQISVA